MNDWARVIDRAFENYIPRFTSWNKNCRFFMLMISSKPRNLDILEVLLVILVVNCDQLCNGTIMVDLGIF